ncbi:MAG: SLC13 family permease [Pseudolabrys sp.]
MNAKIIIRSVALICIVGASGYSLLGHAPAIWQAAAITAAIILLWSTGALPEDQTALIFFASASILGLVGSDVIFSGFVTAAVWLVFAGLVIGVAVRRTGIDQLIATPIIALAGSSYWRAVATVIAISLVLSFTVPSSMTRMMLVIPVIIAFIERLGLASVDGTA